MRLSDLRNAKVTTLDGQALGRVHELHVENGRVVALTCGPGSFLESLTGKVRGRRIEWECVRRVEAKGLVVALDRPQRAARKANAPRSRRGTRQPTARPSKR